MNEDAQVQWATCLAYLRTNLPPQEYATWFEPLRLIDQSEGKVTVSVPTKYVGEYIREHHRELVAQALMRVYGGRTQLIWRDEETFAQHQREDQEREAEARRSKNRGGKSTLPPLNPQLNPAYTFETFVEGESNKLARAVALSIAEKPGQPTFNPFFLYGPSGVGKTHLANALGMRLLERFPGKRVLFVSAHVFRTQFTDSVIHNTQNDFLNFYQSIDVLIIDDIQEITTAKTQQAFFHIFNHLQQNGRQLVITCDRPPVLFEGIEERMLTRFKWGMIAEMERPDTALRKAILENKIKRDGLSFPKDVTQYIAQNVQSSVRELEGIVNSIMAYSIVDNCDINLELAARVVARAVNLEKRELTADDILSAVCQHYGTKQRELLSKSRKQHLVLARQVVMFLCHKYTETSYAQIGARLGGRDHSTVMHGCRQIALRIGSDRDFRHEIEKLEAALKK